MAVSSPNPEVAKQACGCIRNLAVSPVNKEKILQENALPPLINLLESDDPKTQELAASGLSEYLSIHLFHSQIELKPKLSYEGKIKAFCVHTSEVWQKYWLVRVRI